MLKVVDGHVHLGFSKMPERCYTFLKLIGFNDQNVKPNELKLSDDNIEIERIILIPSFPCGTSECTDGFYQQVKWIKGFEDRFSVAGTVNPNCDIDVRKELENQYSLGAVAIKLHPVHHWFKPNDYRPEERGLKNLQYVYEFAEEYKLPVIIHTGTSITVNARNKYGDPIYVDDVIKDFNITIILAHSGRPLWTETAFYLAKNFDNVYLDISSIPPKRLREYLPRIDEVVEKTVYGSDYPNYMNQTLIGHALKMAEVVNFDEKIMRDNILKLIKIH
ncbi:MAG: amidohydrolase family protein [Sulfolobaceae archaeon]|nr:amidohydrolase family protein [Sulfolobaceae archaeon]